MRLQRHGSRKVEGKEYFKWTIVVPPETVKELGWKKGEELQPMKAGNTLMLQAASSKTEVKGKKGRRPAAMGAEVRAQQSDA